MRLIIVVRQHEAAVSLLKLLFNTNSINYKLGLQVYINAVKVLNLQFTEKCTQQVFRKTSHHIKAVISLSHYPHST